MRYLITILLFKFYALNFVQAQIMTDFKIYPHAPTVSDSVEITFKLGFPWFGAKKQKSDIYILSDTILYEGCYWKPSLSQMESYIYDTVRLGKLPIGYYTTFIIRNYVFASLDTNCLNIAFRDTLDTFFLVSPVTRIEKKEKDAFDVFIIGGNKMQISAEGSGELKISVLDAMGRLCWESDRLSMYSGKNIIDINTPNLSPGIYFYRIVMGDKQRVVKILKE